MKFLAALLILFGVCAQSRPADFVTVADRFLAVEVPRMEAAVAAKDREYFTAGLERVKAFVKENWAELDKTPALQKPFLTSS